MSEQATVNISAGLGTLLTGSPPPAPNFVRWWTPRGLRLAVAAADVLQTTWVGITVHSAVTDEGAASWKALCLGLLAAGIATVARRAIRGIDAPDENAGARAGLSTAASICAMGAICWLLSTRPPEVILTWLGVWAVVSSGLSVTLRVIAIRLRRTICGPTRVVVVGQLTPAELPTHFSTLEFERYWHVVAYVDTGKANWLEQLHSVIAQRDVELVALTLAGPNAGERIAGVCDRLADQPVRVCLVIDSAALGWIPRARERFGDAILVDLIADPHGGLDGVAKRVMDIILSALLLIVLSPMLALVAIAVRLESPGPVIFRQKRFGLGGRHIEVLKFRSMRIESCDVTGANRTLARDSRVTRVGRIIRRLSIDELPQLINVLWGDMSLVGPRPHPLHMRVGEQYYFEVVEQYRTRHLVKPGITGWAQVNGSRGEVDTLEKARRRVKLDLWYLENWSFWTDIRIIVKTALGSFLTRGAD